VVTLLVVTACAPKMMPLVDASVTDEDGGVDAGAVDAGPSCGCERWSAARDAGQLGDPLVELSGLVASRSQPGIFYAHNDSGDSARFFAVSQTGQVLQTFVLDGATGKLRDSVVIPFFICAAISDDGAFLAVGDDPAVHVFAWDAGTAKYKAAYDVSPPPGLGAIPWDVQTSAGPDADEMLVVGYISGDVKTVQVAAWSLATQKLVVNWNSKTNAQLQENPTIRADGDYIGCETRAPSSLAVRALHNVRARARARSPQLSRLTTSSLRPQRLPLGRHGGGRLPQHW
jgi:hypothetical protein